MAFLIGLALAISDGPRMAQLAGPQHFLPFGALSAMGGRLFFCSNAFDMTSDKQYHRKVLQGLFTIIPDHMSLPVLHDIYITRTDRDHFTFVICHCPVS